VNKKPSKVSARENQIHLTFRYAENLKTIVRDLRAIDTLIPAEMSRHGCLFNGGEEAAIIEARKSDLLVYIQSICRDHILWGEKLLQEGWEVRQGSKGGAA